MSAYQKRINDELISLGQRKDIIQENTPTDLIGGGPLRDFVPSGNSTADLVLAGSVSQDNGGMTGAGVCGGSKFTKGFKRGFTDAAKGTFKTVKKIVKPVTRQVQKDYKGARKMAVGDLSGLASEGYEQGKQALAQEAMYAMMGAGLKGAIKGVSRSGSKIYSPKKAIKAVGGSRPQSAWITHVKAYQAKHGCSYKDAMKAAKSTYR